MNLIIKQFLNKENYITKNILYENILIIFSPVIFLIIGFLIFNFNLRELKINFNNNSNDFIGIFLGIFIQAHLILVFLRSHGNKSIFKLYPYRFTIIPVVLFVLIFINPFIFVTVGILAVWWDVYHSGLQTFGFGRIYDSKIGNKQEIGRWQDYFFNIILYAGPIFSGVTLIDHIKEFEDFSSVGILLFTQIPNITTEYGFYFTIFSLFIIIVYSVYYIFFYIEETKKGNYKISYIKIYLYVSTSIVSILAWNFNSFGEAFLIMNMFHAIQYFAIVWHTEKDNLTNNILNLKTKYKYKISLFLMLFITFFYGFLIEGFIIENILDDYFFEIIIKISLVVSIMHFWYDGFIWSVKRKDV